jgi:hypothetical protein
MTASSFDLEKKANDRGEQKRGLRCVTRWNGLVVVVVVGLACMHARSYFAGLVSVVTSGRSPP